MDRHLLEKYGGPVPRYTSYPTAPQFHDGIGAAAYADWLTALGPGDGPVSLYLHIPYCRELCTYCGCNTKITRRYAPIAGYVTDLTAEIDLVAANVGEPLAVSHVHFGGGTPNILGADDFLALMGHLRRSFAFGPDTETAVEVDPRVLTGDMAEAMAAAGVTRVSIGVQDLNEDVQQAINRVQPLSVVRRAVAMLRGAGINEINLDLMYGLPLQTVDRVLATVDQVAELEAQRIALFGYAHVPWMKSHQRLLDGLPRADAHGRFEQAEAAARRLARYGYRRIGLDHFATPGDGLARALDAGRLRRNFQGYTTDTADVLLAFGASAIGQLPGGYVQNAPDSGTYRRRIEAGRLATVKGLTLSGDDRRRRAVIERLMCDMAVDLEHFGGTAAFAAELTRLHAMEGDGLVRVAGARVTIPESARPLMRAVAAVFDGYLNPVGIPSAGRHSMAV
ncbi:oxygen-independent coproporphyrinogen III oxidase [Thalassospiraceae bacterium LMO-SO8]|nr:oxygen-independent coproporphyrinogen III oxidase [Alphaproteobacteria bacterium LMO-S08]WND77984.1 oxygen-independent coproporphyrinogen III oxidase [Thalassospiraceae bacterium LMO-SO8]